MCGVVEDKKGKTAATLCGKWDEGLHYVIGDNSGKRKGSIMSSRRIWKRSEPSEHQTRYNLTQFAITLNEITPGLRVTIRILLFFFLLKKLLYLSSYNLLDLTSEFTNRRSCHLQIRG